MPALTLPAIKSAQPGTILRDQVVKGLQLRATATKKAFYLYFRTRAGAERRPKLGDWPTLSLDAARGIARQWLERVAAGDDPVKGWEEEAAAPTIADLCDRYLDWAAEHKKAHSVRDDRYNIDRFVRPKWGKRKAAEITVADVEKLHASMKATPYQANRVCALVSKMFNLAERWSIRPLNSNPASSKHIKRYPESKRRRYLRPEEARVVFGKLVAYGERYPHQAAFLWLLIYTGARPIEIANARPEQRQGDRFELAEHKTERYGAPRMIFLPPQAVAVLDRLPKTDNGTITGIKSPRHLWRKIISESGLSDANLRMYDLRHSFASAGLAVGKTLEDIGQLLGHASAATTKRYAHLMDHIAVDRAREIADALDDMAKPVPDVDPLS